MRFTRFSLPLHPEMKKLAILIIFLGGWLGVKAQLVINELMQSNIDCVMDDLKEFPDSWVELYNPTSQTIDLKGYKLGISDNVAEAYALPSQAIEPGQYVLIYCDKVMRVMPVPANWH